ncbi:MAG: prolyl-tRNA synthetase associated domain-containing protein [Firmicutes bacterium]|nr:prolyl-tRNA synthetase associated domain-containing protein [Bacillota bacterium]
MDPYRQVADKLDSLGIEYEVVEHEPTLDVETADKYIEGVKGVRTKTMFLTNKKKTAYFLAIMDEFKRMDLAGFEEITGTKRIKMASENSLVEKLKLIPGMVSPFGLMNNEERDIKVYIDEDIINEKRMCFFPNTNDKTLFLDTSDFLRFLEDLGYEVNVVKL